MVELRCAKVLHPYRGHDSAAGISKLMIS